MEVLGRYSNHSEQGQRLQELLEMKLSGPSRVIPQTSKQVHRRLRPDEILELVAAYEAGSTVYELANIFRIHQMTVSMLLERQGISRRNRSLSATEIDRAKTLYASGLSLDKVGKQVGGDGGTVRLALLRIGVPMRDSHGRDR